MLATTTTTSSGERVAGAATGAVAEQFWALVCSDEELLNAEFDAIIAAQWPSSPSRTAGRDADQHGCGMPGPGRVGAAARTLRPARPGVDGWSRQRSPPAA